MGILKIVRLLILLVIIGLTLQSCADESNSNADDTAVFLIDLYNPSNEELIVTRTRASKEGESIIYEGLSPSYSVEVGMIASPSGERQTIGAYKYGGAQYGSTVNIYPKDGDRYEWDLGSSSIISSEGDTGSGGDAGSYDWSYTCPGGYGGGGTVPIPIGSCENEYKNYVNVFGCNTVASFNDAACELERCTGKSWACGAY